MRVCVARRVEREARWHLRVTRKRRPKAAISCFIVCRVSRFPHPVWPGPTSVVQVGSTDPAPGGKLLPVVTPTQRSFERPLPVGDLPDRCEGQPALL